MDITMDKKKYEASNCDALNTTALESLNSVNYYDTLICLSEEVKKEFPEDECPQSSASQNGELLKCIPKQEIKQENLEESLSSITSEEIDDKRYLFGVKVESPEERSVLDYFEDAGVHYDVLVTPQQVQCKLCSRIFQNRYTLLIHNNEHIKVVMYPTQVDIEINQLHKCQWCDEHFYRHDMLTHVCNVNNNKRQKVVSLNEKIKPYPTGKNAKNMEYKCDVCERVYKSKPGLESHKKNNNHDYGKIFECRCGKQFRTLVQLSAHKKRHKDDNVKIINNKGFQCDSCHKIFKMKWSLARHISSVHYNYGKIFECSCGKRFRTPIQLSAHKKRHKGANVKIIKKENLQCDYCHNFFKIKSILARHIMSVHYDYGRTFECSCGKRFRTPIYLSEHKKRHHTKVKIIKKENLQCDYCHNFFKTKSILARHIMGVHYDYGRSFECSCGKVFRSPFYLSQHKKRHNTKVKIINKENLQCVQCHKFFTTKFILKRHIINVHYGNGKTFKCWCKKQFRTSILLSQHKKEHHDSYDKIINKGHFQCDYCHKISETKSMLARHIMSVHYDYGKTFECWCGKQFRTPIHLSVHKKQHNYTDVKIIDKEYFQCDYCHIFFINKSRLIYHIKTKHYDYGKTFECWCGKQFRTPIHLSLHKKRQNCTDGIDINNEKFQCYFCLKFFKAQYLLRGHIKNMHYDYGKTFECSCGKQFRSPSHLSRHKRRQNCTDGVNINNEQFQCYSCPKFFKAKYLLASHIKNIHYDYGKTFECSCGKQFRSPKLLSQHKKRQICVDVCIINNERSQCQPLNSVP